MKSPRNPVDTMLSGKQERRPAHSIVWAGRQINDKDSKTAMNGEEKVRIYNRKNRTIYFRTWNYYNCILFQFKDSELSLRTLSDRTLSRRAFAKTGEWGMGEFQKEHRQKWSQYSLQLSLRLSEEMNRTMNNLCQVNLSQGPRFELGTFRIQIKSLGAPYK
jgi:hypothetical protein